MPSPAPGARDLLAGLPIVAALPLEARDALLDATLPTPLEAGAMLLSTEHAPAALHFVVVGRLTVEEQRPGGDAAPIRILAPGEALDQLQVLAGSRGPVEVRAAEPALLATVPDAVRDALAERHPEVRALLERLHRDQLFSRLHELFGALDRALLDALERTADWRHLRRGELLIEQEDVPDALYLVISGRLRTVRVGRDGSVRVLSEAGRGETVGELSYFGCDPRSERVEAVRDSVLVGFTEDEFQQLVAWRPRTLRRVTRMVIERISRPAAERGTGRITNVAVLPASPGAPVDAFCRRLAAALETHGGTLHLTGAAVEARMAEEGIAAAWEGTPQAARLLAWLEAREVDHRFVLYQADAGATPWTRRCLRQADRVIRVASADDPPEPDAAERALAALEDRATETLEVLALVHRDGSRPPSGTSRWLRARAVKEHLHLRWDRDADFGRLARMLAGRAVGVVLGGGGARGFAHIGVLRALAEAGVPVDLVGGTSMGAGVAAQHAMGMDAEAMRQINRRIYLEWRPQRKLTLPLIALVDNRLATVCGERVYGGLEIEDLWTPYFCVTSNLTTAQQVVHRRGPLGSYVLASASIPVFAPPVLDGNQLLVDGALLNNVPTDVMRESGAGVVVASEVSLEEDLRFTAERVPTAWEVLRGRFRPATRTSFPGILETAMRASLLHATWRERSSIEDADFCFRPPVEPFSLMDFTRIDDIIEVGYRYARAALAGWRDRPAA